jgi:FolB domain-containing protein
MQSETKTFSDRIHIHQLELAASVGVPDKERATPQRLTASITLWPLQKPDEFHDDITKTVNYSKVCEETKKFMVGRSDKLIETLADLLAAHLLRLFLIQKIEIELRKFVLADADYVSVTVTRTRLPD